MAKINPTLLALPAEVRDTLVSLCQADKLSAGMLFAHADADGEAQTLLLFEEHAPLVTLGQITIGGRTYNVHRFPASNPLPEIICTGEAVSFEVMAREACND